MGTTTTKRRVGEEMMMMRWTIMIVTLVVVAMYTQVACAGDGTTDVIDSLNGLIAATPSSATYRGGSNYGVLHRAEDGYSFDTSKKVVPAAFIHNDAVAPTSTYPCGNPHCIRTTGSDGIFSENICNYDSYMNAALGWVIGDEGSLKNLLYDLDNIQTDTWGWEFSTRQTPTPPINGAFTETTGSRRGLTAQGTLSPKMVPSRRIVASAVPDATMQATRTYQIRAVEEEQDATLARTVDVIRSISGTQETLTAKISWAVSSASAIIISREATTSHGKTGLTSSLAAMRAGIQTISASPRV